MHRVTSISTWGAHAQRFVERHAIACVAAVFPRSCYLESHGDFLCIGDESIGRGPLNALLAVAEWTRLSESLPPVGTSTRIHRDILHIGSIVLDATRAEPWRPASWPSARGPESVARALRRLERVAAEQAPVDGLARLVLGATGDRSSALERAALPGVQRLRAWLTADAPPPVDLLGLGPGLTPSGDDVLCGMLVALHAVGHAGMAAELYGALAVAAPMATSPISAAFLRAAAEGLGCEALHAAIAAVLEGEAEAVSDWAEALGRIGHTSGWDGMAGAMLVLQAFGSTQRQPARSRMGADLRVSSTGWSVARAGSLRRREFGGSG
jgi:hypothetical protein